MDMVLLAIKLHQCSFKVVRDTGKDALQIAEHLSPGGHGGHHYR
jgi:hypothetical protein